MSLTLLGTKQNLTNGFVASPGEGEIQTGSPLPIGGAQRQGDGFRGIYL